ncbi:hypothetical protein EV401DRAFT_2066150 [Pisolithus croceorrhizus]|nr:hypothetical protein EV401DRAFT_2066150 [Pisolithus croceorrhizus]
MDFDADINIDINLEAQVKISEIIHWNLRCHHLFLFLSMVIVHIIQISYDVFNIRPPHIPYHTSILSGHTWILELMNGHLDHIKTNLSVTLDVFLALINILVWNGITQS